MQAVQPIVIEVDELVHTTDHPFCGDYREDKEYLAMANEQKAMKYIRFNASSVLRPTWVHIASGKPFEIKSGRYGRWTSTVCGREYEMDDYSVVKDEQEIKEHLCKRCAKQKRIEHERGEALDLSYERSA